ncbi:GNAT family N-acetyltransferase [Rhodovulum marinum]|uniref:Acetoin utilization deacetylase AcuC-like enzyme n=1 Tax=Rhodovulum marinum TaxID=320662 RepID=A0A4R2Q655_9RHOB|nr:GNAT family N-acetyltransferase [Rhodovulum marinum]TCP43318.1 acetoin utilization deacetylase AcuC-like enzyme [Rhodovulum marinum]
MFRIRKIADAHAPANRAAIAEAQAILRAQFPGMDPADIDALPDRLDNPFAQRFVADLFVAQDARARVRAAAVLLHDPELNFAFLDVIAADPGARAGSGAGGALYERLRQAAAERGAEGLYFECLPDDPDLSPDPETRRQNADRLRFYERFGARPIAGTAYETPIKPGETDAPYLVFDGLGGHALPGAERLRAIVAAILERKYPTLCPPDYVASVLGSIAPGGYDLRPARYRNRAAPAPRTDRRAPIPLIVNDRHDIHHVRERGYVESPVRIPAILAELDKSGLFERRPARRFPDRWIREVHDARLIDYLRRACAEAPEKTALYPYVFPIRNAARPPKERSVLAGYWCIDTFTPIHRNAWPAARGAVDCALGAAEAVLDGAPAAYALVRPPGHHAEHRSFGGFCYLCNGAIAANFLSHHGRVAILDIDYHHGNGQQDIFYDRADVLTVSIHGDPSFAYPYFTGFKDETGRGAGAGFNLNLALPEQVSPETYRAALDRALARIEAFAPAFLVLSLGFDTARGDPTGTWSNGAEDFRRIGARIGAAGYPTVIVQEGGYRVRTLGTNARRFFEGLAEGLAAPRRAAGGRAPRRPAKAPGAAFRATLRAEDPARIRALVAATGRFSAEEIGIAEDLALERIAKGAASGYEFLLAEGAGGLAGYACFGPIPGSEIGWDLYWIAVAPGLQGQGLGARLIAAAEDAIRAAGGRFVHADTSTSAGYAATRAFYAARGYRVAAEFPDFYRAGDGKAVFEKVLAPRGDAGGTAP